MRARARSFAALAGLWALASGVAQAADEAASVERGRALLANRAESGCVLCHVVPGFAQGGELGPSLVGVGQRTSAQDLRRRIADARSFNPHTIMPPYLSAQGLQSVAPAYQGRTVLTPQGLDDIVAYLRSAAP